MPTALSLWSHPGRLLLLLAVLVTALLAAFAAAMAPVLALGGAVTAAALAAIALHPPLGTYLVLGGTPLLAGIGRDEIIPILRPYEALALLAAAGLALRMVVAPLTIRLGRVDGAIVVLALAGSVLPILMMIVRGRELTSDDVLYAMQLWKYVLVYGVVRVSVRTPHHVGTALWVVLGSAAIVAVAAILQSLQLFGADAFLVENFTAKDAEGYSSTNRGGSTLGSPIATGDVMIFSVAIAAAWLIRGGRPRPVLAGLGVLLLLGTLASGQFSAVLGLVIAIIALGLLTRRIGRLALASAPLALVAAWVLEPVIDARLQAFGGTNLLPQSWQVRLYNLESYFWPQLGVDNNWLTGVRPSARVAAPEPWREWIWIESGYTWLLWSGGVAFLLAFLAFLAVAIPRVVRVARSRTDTVGVAAIASACALWVIAVLMVTDPHLTLRGAADLNFALLAMALLPAAVGPASAAPRSRADPGPERDGR